MSLTKSTSTVGGMTLISRILGFIRDVVIARIFGAMPEMDAFLVAFKIPNFFRRLFAEGAFSQAFIPVLSEYKTQHTEEETRLFLSSIYGMLTLSLCVLTVIAIPLTPFIIMIFAPGFTGDEDKWLLAASLLKITFPYLLLISLTAFAAGTLNTYGVFAAPAFTPVLLNICMIVAAVFSASWFARPIEALAWGVLFGGIVQLAFQWPFLMRLKLWVWPKYQPKHSGAKKVLRLMIPALFGVSIVQVNLLVDTVMASFLQDGSVSWLYYADRLVEFPLGVFGIALATVVLPTLSKQHIKSSTEDFKQTMVWAVRCVGLIGLPASVGLAWLAEPMMVTLFQYGAFMPKDAAMAALSLMAYSVGLVAFILIKVLSTGFFSRQDTKTPVKYAAVAMVVNIVLNVLLIGPLAHAGLALATAVSAWVNAGLLAYGLHRQGVIDIRLVFDGALLRIVLASGVMLVGLWWFREAFTWQSLFWYQRGLGLLAVISAGALIYGLTLGVLRFPWQVLREAQKQGQAV